MTKLRLPWRSPPPDVPPSPLPSRKRPGCRAFLCWPECSPKCRRDLTPRRGPSAGYGYQIERALYWLARSPAGAAVGIETDDDVAVRNGTTSLLEQDKHSIAAGAEPLGDRLKDLWNTLNIWLDAIEENRVDAETTRLLMVTNKELPDGLAKAISAATTAEAAGECVTGLERAAEDPPEKIATLVGRVL